MPGTLDDSNCVSPTPTTSSTGADGPHDSRDYNGRSWSRQHSRSSSALDRHSESSESLDNHSTSSGQGGRPMHDFGSSEYIPTRSSKVSPRVAYNPMQFVKTGPPKIVNTAYEQLRKAEQVKKVREVRKDEAEDWQSNLEGWKSSRRKRQEHVIERVTEVKRMEQEEALKASEAAAKRLVGIREKRGKLSALYSVEDDNEIEFDVPSDSVMTETSERETIESTSSTKEDDVFHEKRETIKTTSTTTTTKTVANEEKSRRDAQEFTYDKAIEQYVKYSTTALSKQETTSSQQEVAIVADCKSSSESTPVKASAPSEQLVKKRAIFERESSAEQEDAINSRASALQAANRRSGEFSSTFKSRLSTFETGETTAASSPSGVANKVAPDAQFKTKLATFHRTASADDQVRKRAVVVASDVEENKPDFKARLAAFRQVETTMKPAPKPKPPGLRQEQKKPDLPVSEQQPARNTTEPQADEMAEPVDEPIYANSSVSLSRAFPNADQLDRLAESSDCSCTEDEGIRSLSPHGTPSPTSPTRAHPDEQSIDGQQAFASFRAFQQPLPPCPASELAPPQTPPPPPAPPANHSEEPNPTEVVWDDCWFDSAPPTEKPPPPPLDDDAVLTFPTTTTTPVAPSPVDSASSPTYAHQQVMTRSSTSTKEADVRKELRKRRSDFLGFDVNAMENDAQQLADAIPPPPDLKSLLRSTSDYRTSETIISIEKEPVQQQQEQQQQQEPDDEELARQEREIIETLEKEERKRAASSPHYSGHNTSNDEFEMNAEIDQLAREWRNDAVLGSGWRAPSKLHQQTFAQQQQDSKQPAPGQQQQQQQQQQQPLHVEIETPCRLEEALVSPKASLASPPKPSRLSAAPKPRLHDGEAWMAKRKLASEAGNQKKDMKDVSRHWLIQEAEQRRIDAMQERNYSPTSSSSVLQMSCSSPVRHAGPASSGSVSIDDGTAWMSRSSSSASVDKTSESLRLPSSAKDESRSASSLCSSPISSSRPLYANHEEILEYADFTGAPHAAPPVWQVRSIVSSSSMDQLSSIHSIQAPARPAKMTQSKSQTLPPPPASSLAQTQPSWRSTHPPETEKEPIPPLPHSVIHTLTQRVSQRTSSSNNNNMANNNYGDYMNVQEAGVQSFSRAGPQVPAQRPANYRHPSLGPTPSAPAQMTNSAVQPPLVPPNSNNNDRMLSVSGKKKCSLCQEELGRGAAMIIESLRLFYHINCFRCCVCGIALGNGTAGTDVRVRNNNLHCHDCYSNDDGLKFSKV